MSKSLRAPGSPIRRIDRPAQTSIKPVPAGAARTTPADLSGLATDPESAACLEVEGFGVLANPLAVALLHHQGWFADVCRYEGRVVSVEIDTVRGIVDEGLGGMRPATDTEAAGMEASICVRAEKTFDSRNPLPRPMAKWLRAMADQIHAELTEAAARIEATRDDRDRDLVRRWVQRDPAIKFSRSQGLVDTSKLATR